MIAHGHLAAVWSMLLVAAGGCSAPGAAEPAYRPPEPGSRWIQSGQLSFDAARKKALAGALVALASLPVKVALEDRSRAIGLAFQLHPGFEPGIVANFKLRHGQPADPVEGCVTAEQVLAALLPAAGELLRGNEADRELGWAVLHLLVRLPERVDEAILLFEKQGPRPDPAWERLYEGLAPSGPARSFSAAEAQAAVLVLAKSRNTREALVARVSAKASASAGSGPARVTAAGGGPARVTAAGGSAGIRKAAELAARQAQGLWQARWPAGQNVVLSVDAPLPWAVADEVSFGAGFAVCLSALVEGKALDPRFGVIGRLGEDGALEPVAGLEEKLRAAILAGMHSVAVGPGMRDDLMDLLVAGGYAGLARVQILSASRMAEVDTLALLPPDRDPGLSEAMRLFEQVARDLGPAPAIQTLRSPGVRTRLARVVELAPNHISARLLGVAGSDQPPQHFSLAGSLRRFQPALQRVKVADSDAELREILFGTRRLRAKLHPAVRPPADAVAEVAEARRKVAELQLRGDRKALQDWTARLGDRVAELNERWAEVSADPQAAVILQRLRADGG